NVAVTRLFLDNFVNFQASWPTMGYKVAQTALFFGCNDFGSTMMEENVVSQAGARHRATSEREIVRQIVEAGFVPVQRDSLYNVIGRPDVEALLAAPVARGAAVPLVPLDELVRRAVPAAPGAGPLRCVVTAAVVYEGVGTARQDAAVALFEDEPGRLVVTDVGPRAEVVAAHPGAAVVDGGFALSPVPVNAHTHLDLSDMPYTPGTYEGFLRAV